MQTKRDDTGPGTTPDVPFTTNSPVLKTVEGNSVFRGFESHSLRQGNSNNKLQESVEDTWVLSRIVTSTTGGEGLMRL